MIMAAKKAAGDNLNSGRDYSVSITHMDIEPERKWGIRFEWVGAVFVLAISLKPLTPACRIVVLGCSVLFGRIPVPPKVVTTRFQANPATNRTRPAVEGGS